MDFSECYGHTVSSVNAAARTGSVRRTRRLIRRGHSVDSRDNRGWSALHEAAHNGNVECVKEVLKAGTTGDPRDFINSLTHEGESALYLAARKGHACVVRLLLKRHADINQMTNDLSCPLYAAVDGGHKDVVELLVRKGAEVNRTHTESCWTCLHQAVYKGHSGIVSVLVCVCDLEARDDHSITPLFVAAQYGQKECLGILINAGADVNAQAEDLATPLLIGSQEGHEACTELLLAHGADPDRSCSKQWPQLPIHAAAGFGHLGILKRLIAVTDRVCDRGDGMVSPLYMAIQNRQIKSAEMLLTEGYSADAQDCTHTTGIRSPLTFALSLTEDEPSTSELVRLLISHGATLGEEDWTYALSTNNTDFLKLILEHRWIPTTRACSPAKDHGNLSVRVLSQQEVKEMLRVVSDQVNFAPYWISMLLKAGLDPSLLIQKHMLKEADGMVLNYWLEFVNWSTLSPSLKDILNLRRSHNHWEPFADFDSIPSLSHMCRLQIRSALGSDRLMRTDAIIRQLPVPKLLHDFLRFRDIQDVVQVSSPLLD